MVSSVRQETHKSYSSRPTKDDATDAGVGGGVNTATSHAQHVVVDDINSRPYHNDIESNGCNNRRKRKKQRGVIYFRSIEPSDRDAIHRLHEDWFPVDYNADFFDSLCNRRVMPGTNEPLYCTVACYKELDDDQFEEMIERNATGCVRDGGTFSFSSKHKRQFTCVTDDNIGDCMLWEADSVDDREGVYVDNNGYEGEAESGSSVQTQAPNTSLLSTSSSPPLYCSPTNEDNPTTNGDMIDNEESFTSIYETKEREKMERFYSNGFRFDTDHYVNKDVSQHRKRGHNETHLNDVGERIIGCLVGSFLSSAIPSSKHSTTLDEKLGRDETAALLVPEPENYSKMFYIMTLGTVREFRRTGLGSLLVERVVDMINTTPECGALYLHVITYNEGAMKLYEKLGFAFVKEIKGETLWGGGDCCHIYYHLGDFLTSSALIDYYTINSINYDCYLYARYFHGNRGHRNSVYCVVYDFAATVLNILTGGLIAV